VCDKLLQHRHCYGPQALPLHPKQILERFLLQPEAVEEIAAIGDHRLLNSYWCGAGGQLLEPLDVEIKIAKVQGDAVVVGRPPSGDGIAS
jgi:hypothetical protein